MASLIKRDNIYYAQYMKGKKAKRISLETTSLQLAKDKLRQLESSLYRGNDNPLPTKTPIDKVLTKYIKDMQARKTAKSVQRDISYLRAVFGPICPELVIKNQKISDKGIKRPSRHVHSYIEANCFEQITRACNSPAPPSRRAVMQFFCKMSPKPKCRCLRTVGIPGTPYLIQKAADWPPLLFLLIILLPFTIDCKTNKKQIGVKPTHFPSTLSTHDRL